MFSCHRERRFREPRARPSRKRRTLSGALLHWNRAHQRLCWRGSSRLGVFGGCERRLMPPCSPPSRNLWLISSSFSSVRAWASRDRYMDYGACAPNNSAGRATAHRPTRRRPPASSDCSRASRRVCAGQSARQRERAATPAGLCGRAGGSGIHPGERREPSKRRRGACRARGRGGSKSTVRAHGLRAEQCRSRPTWSRWCIRRRHRPAASLSAAGSAGMLTDMATARSIHEQEDIYMRRLRRSLVLYIC